MPSTRWRLEPHSAAKHQILRHYLNAWFPILGSQHERVVFLDGFAGPGIYDHGEPGSPIIALRTLLEHSFFPRMACQFEFFFLENRQKRYDSLVEQLEAFTRARGGLPRNVTVVHQQTTFEEAASGLVDDLRQQRARLAPTFAFIDPFGFKGAPIELVGRLLAFDRCEVFFHFMYNRVNQFLAAERITAHLDGCSARAPTSRHASWTPARESGSSTTCTSGSCMTWAASPTCAASRWSLAKAISPFSSTARGRSRGYAP